MGLIAILLTNDENGRKTSVFSSLPPSGEVVNLEFRGSTKNAPPPTKAEGQGKEDYWFFTESWGANKDLGEAPKSCTRKEHESATNSIAKRGQGAIAPCRVKGQRPLWGLGQRPNCSTGDQYAKRAQQRCRQRSVPASNFALPQKRPQAALPTTCILSRQMGATE